MGREDYSALAERFVLFSCEGSAEGVVIEKLVEADRIAVPKSRIIKDPRTFRCFTRLRKASDIEQHFLQQNYVYSGSKGLLIARIVDSRRARFSLSKPYRNNVIIHSYITAPEIEMLIIHNEGCYESWIKQSSSMKPSEFCKQLLRVPNLKSEAFLKDYWSNVDDLERSIRLYAEKHGKRKDRELMLVDLLK